MLTPIKKKLDELEHQLKIIINAQDNFLTKELDAFIFAPSKRLRPALVFLFSKILKIENKAVLDIALALELTHSASLIHDDIIDEALTRRGFTTFYKKYGSKLAVLEGDMLLSLALEVLSKTNLDILKVFSKRIQKTINGELEQDSSLNKIPSEKEYLKKTFNKTGNLFLAGLEALFCLKEIDNKTRESLINFTKNFSLAFQIKNDTDDPFSDIKNGNYTLIVLYFLQENSIEDLNNNLNFDKYKKLASKKIDEYKQEALKSLAGIEDTVYKQALINLCEVTLGIL